MAQPEQKLIWRCRRGVRELDVLLTRFLEQDYAGLTAAERAGFDKFLEQQDPVIMDWLFGRSSAEQADVQAIVERLQNLSGLRD